MNDAMAYKITRHERGDDILARHGATAINRDEFLRDVAALAALLPGHDYVLNLCTDRYHFMVGFAAALCRGQVSLLPPADAPAILSAVAQDYPDLYLLTDVTEVLPALQAVPALVYPARLQQVQSPPVMPEIPGCQPALILFTSGSTGRPVPVPKSWGVLVRSAQAAGERLEIAKLVDATIIGTVPHQHSYGLESVILLGLQFGLAVETRSLLYPADIRAAIQEARCGVLVTTPVHLRTLVEEPGGMADVPLILSATAPLTTALAQAAEACFTATLVEIYGCTEAGQVATRRTTQGAEWHCFDGVEIAQRDGASFASGAAVEGEAQLHDAIEMTGPRKFLLGGRSADMVDVAGKRISLAHLNHSLLGIAGVKDGVFFMPDAVGQRVARLAALVVAPGLTPHDITSALRERIDIAFMPRPLVKLDALPRNSLGKLPRETLLQLLREGGTA